MAKIFNKLVTIIICVSILSVSGIGCASKTAQPALEKQVATVQFGNLAITVSVDGNLVMPQAYDLLFGAPGNVEDVLVEEGDFVKAGQVLATLDDTTERLDIRSANGDVQKVLSDLYETVPLLPQFPSTFYDANVVVGVWSGWGSPKVQTYFNPPDTLSPAGTTTEYETRETTPGTTVTTATETEVTWTPGPLPFPPTTTVTTRTRTQTTTTTLLKIQPGSILGYPGYYPNATALTSFAWAQYEVAQACELFQAGNNYAAATSELYVASSDLESCIKIFEDTINNPKSGLGNIAPFINQDATSLLVQQYYPFAAIYIRELRQLVDSIKQGQADMEKTQELIAQGKYDEAAPLFEPLLSQVNDIGKVVIRNINVIKTPNYTTIYGEDLCLSLYGAAEDSLNKAFIALGEYGLDSPE
ncbi:MAG: efflux RND transporter periplasmic adaptor subunit, partial [Dehalococcoidia bacterium]|nr:efflux RND transporter periplasmic adaptor subunit [Dehalococcoidia bacterium]